MIGLLIYLLQLFPNIIWMLKPPANNVLANNNSIYPILNNIEQIFGISTVAVLILVISKSVEKNSIVYIILAAIFLVVYYVSWILYYNGIGFPWVLIIGLAAMPPLYFLFAGIWLKNYLLIIPCVFFGIAHVIITCSNYLKQ